jgi:DNA-binding PadR family transcriptional regulator
VPILHKTKRRILEELRGSKLHGYELAKRLNLPITGIYQHLRDLSQDKLIVSERRGRRVLYFLTEKGKALLKILEET